MLLVYYEFILVELSVLLLVAYNVWKRIIKDSANPGNQNVIKFKRVDILKKYNKFNMYPWSIFVSNITNYCNYIQFVSFELQLILQQSCMKYQSSYGIN